MIWTQEQRDELIALWDNGKRSYAQMAKLLGLSKNQVVGRMRREKRIRGLEVEHQHSQRKVGKSRKKRAKMLTLPKRAEFPVSRRVEPSLPKPDEGQLASIIDVTGCRWAVSYSDTAPGGHMFCNHATGGETYCPYHAEENVASYSRSLIRKTTRAALSVYRMKAA